MRDVGQKEKIDCLSLNVISSYCFILVLMANWIHQEQTK